MLYTHQYLRKESALKYFGARYYIGAKHQEFTKFLAAVNPREKCTTWTTHANCKYNRGRFLPWSVSSVFVWKFRIISTEFYFC